MTTLFDARHAEQQHRCLADAYDVPTIAGLVRTGVTDGWRCLEVGAGGGSVAAWLVRRVAPSGHVLATDLEPAIDDVEPGLSVLRHDIVVDPLPEAAYDLIHARLVLMLLPQRLAVLDRLVRALRPGGWLQLDEHDFSYGPTLLAPDTRSREVYEAFLAAKSRMMGAAGIDQRWGARTAQAMAAAGLRDIHAVPYLQPLRAGSPGARLQSNHTRQLRAGLVAAGLTDAQLTEVRAVLEHPSFLASSCVFYVAHGRRPQ